MNINPLLMIDYYKACHSDMYPKGITKIVSYYTPRMSRIKEKKLVMFGLQGYIKEYLIDMFKYNFFNIPVDIIMNEYKKIFDYTLGEKIVNYKKIYDLHDLGYLPIEIKAIDEGERIPVGIPMLEVSNTHPDFAWLVNTLETSISAYLWHVQMAATVGYIYREIANKWYNLTVDDDVPVNRAMGDFSLRGQESMESGIKASAAFNLSFVNTATVPSAMYLENFYNANIKKEAVAYGAISTEHSVMCSNFAIDCQEITMLKRLLNDIYPHNNFSMVSDSYDYWNMVNNIIPRCKQDILNHDGCFVVRPDSGETVSTTINTVKSLWDTFGGTINTKGYKVLNPKIRVVYGDGITIQRAESIYNELQKLGFASNNATLGVGSFSFQCLEEDGLKPFTRDTFGIAIKATYCEVNGKPYQIFKNPKTDIDNFKKSHKGMCRVYRENGKWFCEDCYGLDGIGSRPNELHLVFKNGNMIKEQSLSEIRKILHTRF